MRILDNLIYRAEKFNEVKIQYKLGVIYLEGDRVEPNLEEAKRWLERAADQGHEEAARALEGLEGKPTRELQQCWTTQNLRIKKASSHGPQWPICRS